MARKSAQKRKPNRTSKGRPRKRIGAAVAKRGNPHLRVLNCIPSRDVEKDWRFVHAVAAGIATVAPIPPAKDLREAWWDIGDQGQTGACVGWATTDGLLRWHFVKAGRIKKTGRMSERFIWMAAKESDEFIYQPTTFIEEEGTSLKAALDIARKFGSVVDAILPFEPPKLYPDATQKFYMLAAELKINSYVNLGRDLANWRQWLATSGPILTRLNVDATWDNATATGGHLATYDPTSVRGGHAVAFVGYDQKMIIVRNSWSTDWGDNGFAYASDAYAAAAFSKAYGVSVT
jgi:C1A family cysteine protease